ncbi:MAG: MOSC domain-containing protein [Sulfurovum sp.]|nr:MOSC domain-containing protein [Sulfurovum sp.]
MTLQQSSQTRLTPQSSDMTLHAIIIGAEANAPLHEVNQVEAVAGKGLKGDRYYYQRGTFNKPQLSQHVREVSILPYETLAQCNIRLHTDLTFTDLRRNLIIKDFDYTRIEGIPFTIGTATFKIIRTCPPCRYLSRLLGEDMMKGLRHIGGYRAIILESGMITVGDQIMV